MKERKDTDMMYIAYSPGSQILIRPETQPTGEVHARMLFQSSNEIIHLEGWRQINPLIGIHLNDFEKAVSQWCRLGALSTGQMIKMDRNFFGQLSRSTKAISVKEILKHSSLSKLD